MNAINRTRYLLELSAISLEAGTNAQVKQNLEINAFDPTPILLDISDLQGDVSDLQGDVSDLQTYAELISTNAEIDLNNLDVSLTAAISDRVNKSGDTITGDLTINGNLYLNGTEFIVNTESVSAADNLIVINAGEVGAGVTAGKAGIEVDRGTLTNYQFVFDETDDTFKVGEIGDLVTLAARETSPTANRVPYWDTSSATFKTDRSLTLDSSSNLSLIGKISTTSTAADSIETAGGVTAASCGLFLPTAGDGTPLSIGWAGGADNPAAVGILIGSSSGDASRGKSGIFFERNDTFIRGDLILCVNDAADTSTATVADQAIRILGNRSTIFYGSTPSTPGAAECRFGGGVGRFGSYIDAPSLRYDGTDILGRSNLWTVAQQFRASGGAGQPTLLDLRDNSQSSWLQLKYAADGVSNIPDDVWHFRSGGGATRDIMFSQINDNPALLIATGSTSGPNISHRSFAIGDTSLAGSERLRVAGGSVPGTPGSTDCLFGGGVGRFGSYIDAPSLRYDGTDILDRVNTWTNANSFDRGDNGSMTITTPDSVIGLLARDGSTNNRSDVRFYNGRIALVTHQATGSPAGNSGINIFSGGTAIGATSLVDSERLRVAGTIRGATAKPTFTDLDSVIDFLDSIFS